MDYLYLNNSITPDKLSHMSDEERIRLCTELRDKILKTVATNGGHLASNLGVIELTVALLSVYNYEKDKFVFDVGHQCYTYKLLTGRYDAFSTLRTEGGISGFPRRAESKYDSFDTGHSSTSISAGLGIARAKKILKHDGNVVSIIGDGALAGGLAYEALNDLGHSGSKMVIVLNDNEMSIDKNVSALSKYLSKIRIARGYISAKRSTESFIKRNLPVFGKPIVSIIMAIKDFFRFITYHKKPSMFEDMGLVYYGPVDGSNVKSMIKAFSATKDIDAPVIIHVCTKKGKGYKYAEEKPCEYHGVPSFDLSKGVVQGDSDTFTSAFSKSLVSIAKDNKKVACVCAAMAQGTGVYDFSNMFPERFFDCGIAEGHCVTFAAGLAVEGIVPVVAIYSSFLQRGFDEILHDVCFMNNHVVFAIDRAGFVGNDGHTHNGLYDLAYLNMMPNMTIFAPRDAKDLDYCLKYAINKVSGPCAIRYPRDVVHSEGCYDSIEECIKPHVLSNEGKDYAIISSGRLSYECDKAVVELSKMGKKGVHINLSMLKPFSSEDVMALLSGISTLYIVEEGIKAGSVASSMETSLYESGFKGEVKILAIENGIVCAASQTRQIVKAGLDCASIVKTISNS